MDAVLSNIKVLCEFNPVTYPYLSRLFNISSLRRHLCVIWEYMAAHPHPRAKDAHGNGYWSIPVSHLISLHGGTRETWQSHIIFATDAGLLRRVRPDKHSILPELKEEYEEALAKGRRPATFFRVVQYTDETLRAADEKAKQYRDSGLSISHITKADIIRVFGQQRANELYRDGRRVCDGEEEAWSIAVSAAKEQIAERGYATPEEATAALPPASRRKIMTRKKTLAAMAGCTYHAPTQEEKQRLCLTSREWIMTPQNA